jgi:hypothetical protein
MKDSRIRSLLVASIALLFVGFSVPTVFASVNGVEIGAISGVGNYVTAVSPQNIPYVAFQDNNDGGKLTVKKYVSSTWTTVGTAGFSADDIG